MWLYRLIDLCSLCVGFLNEWSTVHVWHMFQRSDPEDGEQNLVDSGTREDLTPVSSVVRSVWEMMVHTSAVTFSFSYWDLFCVCRKSLRLQNTAGKNGDINGKQKELENQDASHIPFPGCCVELNLCPPPGGGRSGLRRSTRPTKQTSRYQASNMFDGISTK